MNGFSAIFLFMVVVTALTQLWLARRQQNSVQKHRGEVPSQFVSKITLDEHQKAADYTVTNLRLGYLGLLISTMMLLIWTLGGGIEWIDQRWRGMVSSPVSLGIAVITSIWLVSSIIGLPLSLYRTFVIEQRYGFNRMTAALFITDLAKGALLSAVIGIPLIGIALWLMQVSGTLWWLYVWLVWISFALFMLWAYPAFIAPLFNKFTPLADDELNSRIEKLLQRTGFTSNGIFIMDGSRRSGHGNAYFTGLGRNKRIVFFDTLIQSLTHPEVEAVLAHELGHFKRHHIHKHVITSALMMLAGLVILGWLSTQAWFYSGLGVSEPSSHAALLLFAMAAPAFTFFLDPIMMWFTRKHEFEADDFAAEQADAGSLIQALVKLYKENAATLTSDWLYSAFHDSHPPAPVRVTHLAAKITHPQSANPA